MSRIIRFSIDNHIFLLGKEKEIFYNKLDEFCQQIFEDGFSTIDKTFRHYSELDAQSLKRNYAISCEVEPDQHYQLELKRWENGV